jgi:hypothetical protein
MKEPLGCSGWPWRYGCHLPAFDKSHLSLQLLELYVKAVIVDPEPDAWSHLVVSMFSAVSGKGSYFHFVLVRPMLTIA